jgi:predicted heme/steroid binding protein
MKAKDQIKVDIDNSKIIVDGRNYDSTHVLIQGANQVSGEINASQVKLTVIFKEMPQVEPTMEEAIKVVSSGSEFFIDVLGEKTKNEAETEEGYILSGDIITIKFESDENGEELLMKVPNVGALRTNKLYIDLEGEISSNIIVQPFIIGAISVRGPIKVKVQVSGDSVRVLREDYKANNEEKKIVSESTAQNS